MNAFISFFNAYGFYILALYFTPVFIMGVCIHLMTVWDAEDYGIQRGEAFKFKDYLLVFVPVVNVVSAVFCVWLTFDAWRERPNGTR